MSETIDKGAAMTAVVVVTYNSEILGSGEFWRGPASDVRQIRNLPARYLALKVISDGRPRRSGMWAVEVSQ